MEHIALLPATIAGLQAEQQLYIDVFFNGTVPSTLPGSTVNAWQMPGEVLNYFRVIGGQTTPVEGVGVSSYEQNESAVPGVSPNLSLHWIDALIAKMFSDGLAAGQAASEAWEPYLLKEWFQALYSNDIAVSAGFEPNYKLMQKAISYSAIETGLVFGNTGIRAMFNDLRGLGGRFEANSEFLRNIERSVLGADIDSHLKQALTDAIVQFAGAMALGKVSSENNNPAGLLALDGILSFSANGITRSTSNPSADGAGADVMFVDLSSQKWDNGKPSGSTTLAPTYLSNWLETALVKALIPSFPVAASNNETLNPQDFAFPFSIARMPELFSMVYGEGDTVRGWSDDRITSHYINGAAFLIGNESQQVLLPTEPGGSDASEGGSATIVLGTTAANNVVGTAYNEVYLFGEGNDTVTAGGGADIVLAGDGNDTLDGGDGDDLLVGDANSEYEGTSGNDLIYTGEGLDTVVGGLGDDTIIGAVKGNSTVEAWSGHNEIHGGYGNDSIEGGDGADLIFDLGVPSPMIT